MFLFRGVGKKPLRRARGRGQGKISFSSAHLPASGPDEWRVERHEANWLVKRESRLITIHADDHEIVSGATVERAGGWLYVALYEPMPLAPYRLVAIDESNGKAMWSSKVWGPTQIMPRGVIVSYITGTSWHHVAMQSSEDRVVVFGISGRAVYIDAFDRRTGKCECRFSSGYFDAITPR